MSNRNKAIIIDIVILCVYAICLVCFLRFGYDHIYTGRLIPAILTLISIPICWGTLFASYDGKKTIGNIIVGKKKK